MNIVIAENFQDEISAETVKLKADIVADALNLVEVDYSIVFETDSFVQSLNEKFRQVNAPTDVLSFEADVVDPDTKKRYLGDIIISIQTIKKQAEARNILLDDEICVVLVHGFLHLLGMDHGTAQAKKDMWATQDQILRKLNVDPAAFPQ